MVEDEFVSFSFFKPKFSLGQVVYFPHTNGVKEAEVLGYNAKIWREGDVGDPVGGVFEYDISSYATTRHGVRPFITQSLPASWLYVDRVVAELASRFLPVDLDGDSWRLVLGDSSVDDFSSPFHLENREFGGCCNDIEVASMVLEYCRNRSGLLVQERDELVGFICGVHPDSKYVRDSNVGRVFGQLEMDCLLE